MDSLPKPRSSTSFGQILQRIDGVSSEALLGPGKLHILTEHICPLGSIRTIWCGQV